MAYNLKNQLLNVDKRKGKLIKINVNTYSGY